MKTLILGEKPSVAADIAKALGVQRTGDFYENDDLVISSCIGHLVEIFAPEAEQRGAKIPIIPESFSLRAVERTAKQFGLVKKLMHRGDIGIVVNACDAGREGEAIFRLVYELAGCTKKMERMWLQSMTKGGITSAWKERRPGAEFDDLCDAARSRNEADWLVGINGSRAMGDAVGRVMTPTLALVVNQFKRNRDFVPTDYFEVFGTFGLASGNYRAKWIRKGDLKDAKIEDRSIAEELITRCQGKDPSSVTDESKPVRKAPPFLFDLTSLQREANRKFKFSAAKTLTIAQALYEKHKVTSYPRTDSQRLPEDYIPTCIRTIESMSELPGMKSHAKKIIDSGWIKPNKRIFDDSKISDHFAIIPTGLIPSGLSADEEKIYGLVSKRFIAIFFPDAEYLTTVRTTILDSEVFRASGSVLVSEGWQAVYGKEEPKKGEEESDLPILQAGESARTIKLEIDKKRTKAPELYTEATLLTAMETAGKLVDDNELADAMKERGLGTPATRAATIEKLLYVSPKGDKEAYMVREGTSLVPTKRGIELIEYLDTAAPKLVSPELTGAWEYQLIQMEQGKTQRSEFMRQIESFVRELVNLAKSSPRITSSIGGSRSSAPSFEVSCPRCSETIVSDGRVLRHQEGADCDFMMWSFISRRQLTEAEIRQLLETKKTGVLSGFKSKEGKDFSAALKLKEDGKVEFVFGPSETKIACPKCSAALNQNGKKLECSCGFSLWTEIAGKALSEKQLSDLMNKGKTAVIEGFVSKKSGKKFAAAVLMAKDGSTSFEFQADGANDNGKPRGQAGDKCPTCKKGSLVKRDKEGKQFIGCTGYPSCRHFEWVK